MSRKHHILILAGLLGLSCLVQAVVIRRATTTGLDAVRFAQIAQSIERQGLIPTLRTHGEQPLFPAWVWVVHRGLRRTVGEFPSIWAATTQLAAAVPLVLAVVPLYLLLLRLVSAGAALAGSLFFCVLPEVARLGADGISDSTHLLFFCVALWAMVKYLERRKTEDGRAMAPARWMLLAGVAVAVAALARVEVLVLAAALGLTLAVFQLLPDRREAWGRLALASACFLLGLALIWTPYLAAAAAVTPRTAVARILGHHRVEEPLSQQADAALATTWRLPDGEPMSFDVKEPSVSLRHRGYAAAVVRFGSKLADAAGYWIGGLALLGAWRLGRARAWGQQDRDHSRQASAGDRLVQVFFVLYCLVVIRFSAVEGYLACRHVLVLVVAGLGAAGHGALELGSSLASAPVAARQARRRRLGLGDVPMGRPAIAAGPSVAGRRAVAWTLAAVAGTACLPQTFARVHDSRLGHRGAGEWQAGQADLRGTVLDTRGWTGLYSGRATYRYDEAPRALSDPHLAYLVLEGQEIGYESDRSQTLRWLIATAGQPVAEFPDPATRRPNQQPVAVYRWHADRFLRLVRAQTVGTAPADECPARGAITALRSERVQPAVCGAQAAAW